MVEDLISAQLKVKGHASWPSGSWDTENIDSSSSDERAEVPHPVIFCGLHILSFHFFAHFIAMTVQAICSFSFLNAFCMGKDLISAQ